MILQNQEKVDIYGEFFHSKKQPSKANLMGFIVILSQYMVI